jgi:hypothetical protein
MSSRNRWYSGILLIGSMVCAQSRPQPPSNPRLAEQIEQLLQKELSEEKADPTMSSKVRQIFVEHGVPTIAQVGQPAAEDYVVLAAHDQPVSFLQQILPSVKKSAEAGKILATSYVYLRALLRQRQIEESLNQTPTNPKLRDQIEELFKTDQAVRQNKDFDAKKMQEIDRRDAVQVRAIFAKYGVPTYRMVGPEAAKDFVVLVEHQPLEFMREVLPQLKQNVAAGQADPANYATMFDRVQTDEHKPQRYGMNFICTPDGRLAPSAIEDVAHLDQRRAEMGLLPMRLYSRLVTENSPQGFCEKVATGEKHEKN